MWVVVEAPPGWEITEGEQHKHARPPSGNVELGWSTLRDRPEEQEPWIVEVLGARLPRGATVELGARRLAVTRLGWSVLFVEAKILLDGEVIATRVGAFYAFLEHSGHALAESTDPAAEEATRDAIAAAMMSARPDFTGPLVSVADFWRGSADEPAPTPPTDR